MTLAANMLGQIDAIENTDNGQDAVDTFFAAIAGYGFKTLVLGHMINPSDIRCGNSFYHTNWPEEWKEAWIKEGFIVHDPIARYAMRTKQPFYWSDAYRFASHYGRRILDMSREFGFSEGLALSITTIGNPTGLVSLGAIDRLDLSPKEVSVIELLAIHLYCHLEKLYDVLPLTNIVDLSRREIDVLQYAAIGKTNGEIATILGISDLTARDYLGAAMKKLGAVNRSHAVSAAIRNSLILP